MEPSQELTVELGKRGYKARRIPVGHVRDMQLEIERRHDQSELDPTFFAERLSWFEFAPPESLSCAKSVIVVAVPRPQSKVVLNLDGRRLELVSPPTYVAERGIRDQVLTLIGQILGSRGYQVARAALPVKLLAVRSGLGRYGRNNICYVDGLGSFLQLVAVYSDLACEDDPWQDAQMADRCKDCWACRQRCPTGAIPADRFLLRAERCIVFHNERAREFPFPDWIAPSWHNCLIGCMRCQSVCPLNRDVVDWFEGCEEFTEKETALLLEGTGPDRLSPTTREKLERLDLMDSLDILPRNLGVLLRHSVANAR